MIHSDSPSDLLKALPLSETTFLIMASLQNEPRHGYAIMKEVEALSQGRVVLSTGTLYGAIKRLLGEEWIRRTQVPGEANDRRGRKFYALTDLGQRVLDAETQRLRELVEIAGRRIIPGARSSGD